jgi:hypothetical protein
MVAIDGAWSLQSTNTAKIGRYHDVAFLGTGTSALSNSARSGVLCSTSNNGTYVDLWVGQHGSGTNLSVDVFAGAGVINRAGQGPYLAISSSTVTVTLSTADPTNPRIDLIIMRVYDGVLSDGSTQATIEAVTGTPASSPVAPSLPTNTGGGTVAIPLAQVRVNANATGITQSNITDVRNSAGLRGGFRPMLPGDNVSSTSPTAYIDGEGSWVEGAGGTTGNYRAWVGGKWNDVWLSPGLGFAKYVAAVSRSITTNNSELKFQFDSGATTTPDITAAVGAGYSAYTDFTFNRAGVWEIKFHSSCNALSTQAAGWFAFNLRDAALTTVYRNDIRKILDGTNGANGETQGSVVMTDAFNVGDTLSCTYTKWDANTATYSTDVSAPGKNCVTFRWVGPK